jgi:hypothetical protein
VRVTETPVELGVGVERRGDAFEETENAGKGAGGKREITGPDAQRAGVASSGGCRQRFYRCTPVTATLMSCSVVAAPSVARARNTYSPGVEKVAVTAALPESALAAGGLKVTPAGPRHTNHDTWRRPSTRAGNGRSTCGTLVGTVDLKSGLSNAGG